MRGASRWGWPAAPLYHPTFEASRLSTALPHLTSNVSQSQLAGLSGARQVSTSDPSGSFTRKAMMSERSGWAASHRSEAWEHLKIWAEVWQEDRKSQLPCALPRFSPLLSPTCLPAPETAHFKSISDSPARCTSSENHKLVYWMKFLPRDELSFTDSWYRASLVRVAWTLTSPSISHSCVLCKHSGPPGCCGDHNHNQLSSYGILEFTPWVRLLQK